MGKRPDFVNDLPDGSTEHLHFKAMPDPRGHLSWMRKIVGPDGRKREVWHEVADPLGEIIHAHQYSVRPILGAEGRSTDVSIVTTPSTDVRSAAAAIAERYARVPAAETEVAIAVLALWLLTDVEAGRLGRAEADEMFMVLDAGTDAPEGPDLSDAAHDLLVEGNHFHHYGEEWGTDPATVRRLAFDILRPDGA